MRFKLTLAMGFAIGYVLGSKAGRQRYEQILRTTRKVMDSPSVQGAAGMLQAQAEDALYAVRGRKRPEPQMNGHSRYSSASSR